MLKVKVKLLSHVRLFVTPWTVAHQAPQSMGFSRQEYWCGLLFPAPGDLPDPEIEPRSPTSQADALTSESNYYTIALFSHASKVLLKILQARLQQYMNHELPYVQAGFGKGRGTRDQIANICWTIKKAREFQKNIYHCFIDYAKAFDFVGHNKLWKILKRWEYQTTSPASWETCIQFRKQQLELDME